MTILRREKVTSAQTPPQKYFVAGRQVLRATGGKNGTEDLVQHPMGISSSE